VIGCPALSPKELKLALAHLKGRYTLRDRALVILGVRSGLRISELLALKVGQVWDGRKVVDRFYIKRQATKACLDTLALHSYSSAIVFVAQRPE
jgi:integrase